MCRERGFRGNFGCSGQYAGFGKSGDRAADAPFWEPLSAADSTQSSIRIAGIGLDLVRIADFQRRTPESHPAFYALVFTSDENRWCRQRWNPDEGYAACFAIKEAALKALDAAGVRVAVPQIEVDLNARSARLVSRRGEKTPELLGLRLAVSFAFAARGMVQATVIASTDGRSRRSYNLETIR